MSGVWADLFDDPVAVGSQVINNILGIQPNTIVDQGLGQWNGRLDYMALNTTLVAESRTATDKVCSSLPVSDILGNITHIEEDIESARKLRLIVSQMGDPFETDNATRRCRSERLGQGGPIQLIDFGSGKELKVCLALALVLWWNLRVGVTVSEDTLSIADITGCPLNPVRMPEGVKRSVDSIRNTRPSSASKCSTGCLRFHVISGPDSLVDGGQAVDIGMTRHC